MKDIPGHKEMTQSETLAFCGTVCAVLIVVSVAHLRAQIVCSALRCCVWISLPNKSTTVLWMTHLSFRFVHIFRRLNRVKTLMRCSLKGTVAVPISSGFYSSSSSACQGKSLQWLAMPKCEHQMIQCSIPRSPLTPRRTRHYWTSYLLPGSKDKSWPLHLQTLLIRELRA